MHKNTIIKGTLILTLTGFITRLMGFFFRIFLSRHFGEESVGLYQLIFPVYALGFSFTSAGIEIALSRLVAKHNALGRKKEAREILFTSIILSFTLSVFLMLFLQKYHLHIAVNFLKSKQAAPLLLILSYVFPFASIHSCIVGYYLGLKNTKVAAFSQLLEQSFRILFVLFLTASSHLFIHKGNISIAVGGLIIGEIASSSYCIRSICGRFIPQHIPVLNLKQFFHYLHDLVFTALPLSASRVCLNFLQSVEAVCIPLKLQAFGLSSAQSLSMYGVLTGMALPCILFPSAITNSVSTMLLPTVAEIDALNNKSLLKKLMQKTIFYSVSLGFLSGFFLLLSGKYIGRHIFHSEMASDFIITLAWMCPFLYTNTTLISSINGMGKTNITFAINVCGLIIRVLCVMFFIPQYGIIGYLRGLLLSQFIVFSCCIFFLHKKFRA